MIKYLQSKPRWLEKIYAATHWMLRPLRHWLKPGGWVEGTFVRMEHFSKKALFDCQMCGQCVLHSTGMTCPMTCPKNLRNGPCGGVRDGWLLRDRTLHAVCLGERVGTLQGDAIVWIADPHDPTAAESAVAGYLRLDQ